MTTPTPVPDDPAVREREPPDLHELGRLKERSLICQFLLNRADWLEGLRGYAQAVDDHRFMAMKIERGDHLKEPTP